MTIFDEALKTLGDYIDHIGTRPVVVLADDGDLGSLSTRIAAVGMSRICIISLGAAVISREIRSTFPHVTFFEAWTIDRIQRVFESMEPAGAILDFSGMEHGGRQQMFENLVLNLADGGIYLVPDDTFDVPSNLNSYVAPVYGGHKVALYQVSGRHLIKLADEHATGALTSLMGASWGEQVFRVEPNRSKSRVVVRSNNEALQKQYCPDYYNVPAMYVRKYTGVSVYPGSLAILNRFVLTDSFRHHLTHRLANAHIQSPSRFQAVAPDEPTETLEGVYYFADNDRYSHFGHIMTEFVSKLWAWDEIREIEPNLKLLVSGTGTYEELPGFLRAIIEGFGISSEDVEVLNRPVKVEVMYGATPQYQNPRYVHQGISNTYNRVGREIAGTGRNRTRKIFLDRVVGSGDNNRVCHNSDVVKKLFIDEGFEIVRPEILSFEEQVILMNEAVVVAGYAGSAFFSSVFTLGPLNLIVIGSESYDATNEFMIASAKGGKITHVWCTPDHPKERHWTMKAFTSDFTFDEDRDSALIKDAINEYSALI